MKKELLLLPQRKEKREFSLKFQSQSPKSGKEKEKREVKSLFLVSPERGQSFYYYSTKKDVSAE